MSQHVEYAPPANPAPAKTFKLIDEKTGEEIALPARRTCWDGAEVIVRDFKASRFIDNPGYLYTTFNETFVPSVCGLKIVEFPLTAADEEIGAGGSRI